MFDIKDFYPSISKKLLTNALEYATENVNISDEDINIDIDLDLDDLDIDVNEIINEAMKEVDKSLKELKKKD